MTTQHTPGPWELGMRGGFNGNFICDRSGDDMHTDNAICCVFGMYQHQKIAEQQDSKGVANARLIAAAPELLAFAQEFLKDYQSEDGMASIKHYARAAQAAIAKATGETK